MHPDDAAARTFSDSWHRVAQVRVELRSSVRVHRQIFRGQPWVMLRDTLSSDWFRVSADAWAFVRRLSLDRTIDEVWMQTLEHDPDVSLTQEEVVQLLGQLNLSNLLNFDRSSAGVSLFDRYTKRRRQETKALLMGFLAIKIPLFDPDRMLQALMPLIRLIFSPIGALAYLALLAVAGKTLIDSADRLFDQGEGLLSPGNLPLLYIGFVIAKVIHELGHAAVCRRYGGEVHKLGIMLLIFAPMPYVDATSSWGFRSRAERVFTGAAGVVAELGVAAVAALIWANSAPGVVNAIAYNVIFVASVSSLLFNLNPLLRFDGYHMLVDLIGVPNLFQRSREQLRYIGERFLLGLPNGRPAARTATEAWLLPVYGVLSIGYWLLLMSTIVFFIAGQYLDLGVALAWLLGFTAVVLPLFKFLKFLFTSPRLHHYRARTMALTVLIAALILLPLAVVPLPDRIRASGVLEAAAVRQLASESSGFLVELIALPGATVVRGEPLMRLRSPELDFELRLARQQREQFMSQELRATSMSVADVMPLRQQREAIESAIAELERQSESLWVRAPIDGIWSAPEFDTALGRWVARGASLGAIIDPCAWRFVAVLPQVATHLFNNRVHQVEVRLRGQEHLNIVAADARIVPYETGTLPSRALGFAGGGDIAVSPADQSGLTAAEPFFRIQAALPLESLGRQVGLAHGRLGILRLTLDDAPLLVQWDRGVRQFLQRRFRV
jgi:putative peptide zinc metalloprotease protein